MHRGIASVVLLALIFVPEALSAAAKDYSLRSPNKAIEVKVAVGPTVTYAVSSPGPTHRPAVGGLDGP